MKSENYMFPSALIEPALDFALCLINVFGAWRENRLDDAGDLTGETDPARTARRDDRLG